MKRELDDLVANKPSAPETLPSKRLHLLKSRFSGARPNGPNGGRRPLSIPVKPGASDNEAPHEIEKPNYKPSGILDEGSVFVCGKNQDTYEEPADRCDAPSPSPYRFYSFEDHDEIQSTIRLSSKSFYIIGSDETCDIVVKHPSVRPRHAAVQFRKPADEVRLSLIDLSSTDGTLLNGKKIPTMRYVGLLDKDVIQFGKAPSELLLIADS